MPLHATTPFDREITQLDLITLDPGRLDLVAPDPVSLDPLTLDKDPPGSWSPDVDPEIEAWFEQNMTRKTPARREIDWRAFAGDFTAIMFVAARYAVTSFLIVLGAPLFLFLFFAGWDLELLFGATANLADHYAAAGPLRRLAFSQDLMAIFVFAVGVVGLARLPRFMREFAAMLDRSART